MILVELIIKQKFQYFLINFYLDGKCFSGWPNGQVAKNEKLDTTYSHLQYVGMF